MPVIVFDYDGTLHETMRIYGPAFRKNYARLVSEGLMPEREIGDDEIAGWLGYTSSDMWNAFAPQLSEEEKAKCSRFIQDEMQRLIADGTACFYDGAAELLDGLKAEGYRLVLLTNSKTIYLEAHRRTFGLDKWFDKLCWAEKYGWQSKDRILSEILKEYPGPCVVIGDRFHDIDAARICGVPSIGCLYGYGAREEYASAAAIAECPGDLPALIRSIFEN